MGDWLKGLPWWTPYAFTGGLGLMGAFASTVLSTDWQALGFAVGALSAGAACVGVAIHVINERRSLAGDQKIVLAPSHVVILGLLIVIAGLGMGLMRGRPPEKVKPASARALTGRAVKDVAVLWGDNFKKLFFKAPSRARAKGWHYSFSSGTPEQ